MDLYDYKAILEYKGQEGSIDNISYVSLFSDIFYLGKESGYKYSSGKKWHWGRLHYLKPQN